MNKKISISIIAIIVVTVIAIILLINMKEDSLSKLGKVYNKMIANQTYAFTRYNFEEENKLITYKKEGKTLIDMYNSGEHLSTLISEENGYLIDHADKEYYVYPKDNLAEEIVTDNLKKIIKLPHTEGKEKIYGKTYKYEEYSGVSEFLISASSDMDLETIKTRFYFKGDELVYLKTIYDIVNRETGERIPKEELQTIKIEYEVEDSIFEIPSDYAEN